MSDNDQSKKMSANVPQPSGDDSPPFDASSGEKTGENPAESFPVADSASWTLGGVRRTPTTAEEFDPNEKHLPAQLSDKRRPNRDRLW